MNRLDKEIVERNLAPTRAKAQELIKNESIRLNGKIVTKASLDVLPSDNIEILDLSTLKYVSRAGLKLEKAIDVFNIDFKGKKVMDIGSSTGGFTDCALQNGAKHVVSVDVGTNVMHPSLRNNPHITLLEQTNIKTLDNKYFENIDIILIDVSFISLSKIFEKIFSAQIKCDIMALIKPQFECGKAIADKYKGLILNPKIHLDIIQNVTTMASEYGFNLINLSSSPIKGGDGNIEYISYFSNHQQPNDINIKSIINQAFDKNKRSSLRLFLLTIKILFIAIFKLTVIQLGIKAI